MKALMYSILISGLFSYNSRAQEIPVDSMYFGQTPPGKTPEKFAPGIISLDNRNDLNISFSPDSKEIYYGTNEGVFFREYMNNSWSDEQSATFSGFVNPNFSADGNKIYLTKWSADYSNSDFWITRRIADGWSTPELLTEPYNSDKKAGIMSETVNGIIYFDSGDRIWQTLTVDSMPAEAVQLELSGDAGSPCISHDGSYLIFSSARSGKIGDTDLFITFKKDEEWTEPVNINSAGANINVEAHSCIYPSLSPDGKFLFYNYHNWTGLMPDIYWVSTGIIDDLRQIILSISEKGNNTSCLKIYPNPADAELNIEGLAVDNVSYIIFKIDGTIMKQGILGSPHINISDYDPGIYLLKLVFRDRIISRQFSIQ